jgi:hypothetical protein
MVQKETHRRKFAGKRVSIGNNRFHERQFAGSSAGQDRAERSAIVLQETLLQMGMRKRTNAFLL